MYPSTTFTRSIGDSIVETIGVPANLEIVVLELTKDHPLCLLVKRSFEFLSSNIGFDMVKKYNLLAI